MEWIESIMTAIRYIENNLTKLICESFEYSTIGKLRFIGIDA